MSNDAFAGVALQPAHASEHPVVAGPVSSAFSKYRGLGPGEIAFTGGFWGDIQQLNATTIIEHCETWMERVGWIANFDWTSDGTAAENRKGIEFVDSEIYKLLEAMAWELGRESNEALERRFDNLVRRVAAAQAADGYLNTGFGGAGQPARYSNFAEGHELYCFGHLIQAGVARIRTGHDDLLVDVALRAADHLYRQFGPDGEDAICGHPEVEMALVELGRATGDRRFIDLAAKFIELRGHGWIETALHGSAYFLDDQPVRDATVLRGHAVRALYLASGAFDVATETDDAALAAAVVTQWENTVGRRTYLTGGMGSRHDEESFGLDFELPTDRAYAETCASVASVQLNWRLLLASGDERYADLLERTLLNNVLASPREDGRAFFYSNTLHLREPGTVIDENRVQERAESALRAPWFSVSCCPTNIARTLASASYYFATTDAAGIQLHQYGEYSLHTRLANGTQIALDVASGYPFDGNIAITIRGDEAAEFVLGLRIPAWAEAASTLAINGQTVPTTGRHVELAREFAPGDVITLTIPMEARTIWPDARIDAIRGQVAVQRGPLVLVLESVDLPTGIDFDEVELDASAALRTTQRGATATLKSRHPRATNDALPYFDDADLDAENESVDVDLIPYFSWANRGPSRMRVWMPTASQDSSSTTIGDVEEPVRFTRRAQ